MPKRAGNLFAVCRAMGKNHRRGEAEFKRGAKAVNRTLGKKRREG